MNKNSITRHKAKFIAAAMSGILLISGCSLTLPVEVDASERDISGQFDGKWVFQLKGILGNCKFNFVNRTYLTVENGVGKTVTGIGYIAENGDFRIRENVVYNSGKIVRIYGGNLLEGNGRVVVDHSRFNATDCSRGFTIQKV